MSKKNDIHDLTENNINITVEKIEIANISILDVETMKRLLVAMGKEKQDEPTDVPCS